jgi:hypothetical protein
MPLRTQLYDQSSWIGGLNTSQDESRLAPNQLVRADNIEYSYRGSKKRREGIDHNFGDLTVSYEIGSVSTAASQFNVTSHNFQDDDAVEFTTTNTLPTSVSASVVYYVRDRTASNFRIAATPGGSAITIPSAGSGTHTIHNVTSFVAGIDFWRVDTGVKTHSYVTVGDNGRIYNTTAGGATTDISGSNKFTVTGAGKLISNIVIFNNKTIIFSNGAVTTNLPRVWTGSSTVTLLSGTPTDASFGREHLGRLWTNSRTYKDRLYYSTTGDETVWGGTGDSGALDIGVNDGDPDGITAIFPTFQGVLFVAKRTKLYKVVGVNPEDFQVVKVSDGVGCVAHNSIAAIDQTDIIYASDRGLHSLATTNSYGDFEGQFISFDIQRSYLNDIIDKQYMSAAYLPTLNCYAIVVTDTNNIDTTSSGTSALTYIIPVNISAKNNSCRARNTAIYLFHIPTKSWLRWPNLSAQCIFAATDSDKPRFYLGSHRPRLSKGMNNNRYDLSVTGAQVVIQRVIKSGKILVDGSPYTYKKYNKFSLLYTPKGVHNILVDIQVDSIQSYSANNENVFNFSGSGSGPLLGSTFTLGQSVLGGTINTEVNTLSMVGFGKTLQITITDQDLSEEDEIQGFLIEWLPSGTKQDKSKE